MATKKAKLTQNVVDAEDIRDIVKANDKVKQYRRIVKAISENIDLEKLDTELRNLHAGRSSRRLYGNNPTVESIQSATLQDAANRSRIAEIRVEATRQNGILEEANKSIKRHILAEFRDHTSEYKTKGERIDFAEQHIQRGIKLQARIEDFIKRCDFIIKDVDQMGFSLMRAAECLQILYSSKNDRKI